MNLPSKHIVSIEDKQAGIRMVAMKNLVNGDIVAVNGKWSMVKSIKIDDLLCWDVEFADGAVHHYEHLALVRLKSETVRIAIVPH